MTTTKHVSGTIKALEWTEWDTDCWFSSLNGFTIAPSSSVNHEGEYRLACDRANFRYFTTIDAAKAAAQADYEARILAAIQPEPEQDHIGDSNKMVRPQLLSASEFMNFTRQLPSQPYDEQFDNQSDVEADPCGAWVAIQHMANHLDTPSIAGIVSVEAAAKVLLDKADDIWTAYMSTVTDVARNKARKEGHKYRVIDREGWKAALRAIAGEVER